MVDKPVIGAIARTDALSSSKIEVIGKLKPREWDEFFECIKECAAAYGGRVAVRRRAVKMPKKKKRPTR